MILIFAHEFGNIAPWVYVLSKDECSTIVSKGIHDPPVTQYMRWSSNLLFTHQANDSVLQLYVMSRRAVVSRGML